MLCSCDYKGEFNLPINLAIGLYSCQIEYSETQINNITYTTSNQNATITVINEISNKNITILTTEKFNNPYQANKSFTGQLTTLSTNILPGQHISIKLTRLSSGASKTYDTVTDYTGTFKLQINLAPGEYIGQCTYTGTDKYQPSTNTNTITVY